MSLIGQYGLCSQGRPGLITNHVEIDWGWSYVGIGLDDGTPWASRDPYLMTIEEVEQLRRSKL